MDFAVLKFLLEVCPLYLWVFYRKTRRPAWVEPEGSRASALEALRSLAKARGGQVTDQMTVVTLETKLLDHRLEVSLSPARGWTEACSFFRTPFQPLAVYQPRSFFAPPFETDLPVVAVDDEAFSRQSTVYAADAKFATDLLNEDVRRCLLGLSRRARGSLSLRLGEGGIILREAAFLCTSHDLARFVDGVAALGRVLLDSAAGRRVIAVAEPVETSAVEGVCLVCGSRLMASPIVACKACGTPYHRECWEYERGCSVYACAGRTRD